MKQGPREVLVSSVPALPLPSLPFPDADFILIQRETKQGRAGEREKSLFARLSITHLLGRWGWKGREWCTLPQASQEVVKGHRLKF